jgi:hypothetical protein
MKFLGISGHGLCEVGLFTTQPTTSPGGLLLVILGMIAESPAVIILKLEKEEGARIVPHAGENWACGGLYLTGVVKYDNTVI